MTGKPNLADSVWAQIPGLHNLRHETLLILSLVGNDYPIMFHDAYVIGTAFWNRGKLGFETWLTEKASPDHMV